MSLFVILFQFAICDMGINLRRCERFMSQQFFHAVDSRAMVEHCRRIGMAQRMRRPLAARDPRQGIAHHVVDQLAIKRSALFRDKKRFRLGHRATQRAIQRDQLAQLLAKRHDPIFITLAMHF